MSVDHKPECPVKDSRGCSVYLQQHHGESREGQSGHEEAQGFVTPAVIAEGCEASSHMVQWLFTSLHHFPQKDSV